MSTWLERLTQPSPTNEAPTRGELRRNDLLAAALVVFALFLAFGIRNQVLNAGTSVRLGENLPRITYPERWRQQSNADALLHVVRAGSPSTFDTRMVVTGRALRTDESLDDARADRGIKLATSLPGYRELEAERMLVLDGQPALVSTYAYIADPTRDAGATGLPVVVEAQDIMFLGGGQFLAVTLEADAADWEEQAREFAIITDSLRLRPLPEEDADPLAPATPATEPTALPDTGASEDAGASEIGSFGGNSQTPGGVMPGESETTSGGSAEQPAATPVSEGSATESESEGGD